MVGECSVVDESILRQDGEVLADVVVKTYFILGLHHVSLAVCLIHVVTCLGIEFLADDRSDDEGIYTLCLVANLSIQVAVFSICIIEVVDALGKSHTC